jgi:hypothetical protein
MSVSTVTKRNGKEKWRIAESEGDTLEIDGRENRPTQLEARRNST